jgi:hypothetical protein
VFRGAEAVKLGVSRKQISALVAAEIVRRELPDVCCMSAVAASSE